MRRFANIPATSPVMRLCLTAILAIQAMLPGLGIAAMASGPVVPAILCSDHGPVEVLIDLGTGEPVETAHPEHCNLCLVCGAVALASSDDAFDAARYVRHTRIDLAGHSDWATDAPLSYAAARGPPRLL